MKRHPVRLLAEIVAVLVLGAVIWVVAAYLATAPLGLVFGWSGHPSIPDAPSLVYVVLYLVVLPIGSLWLAWRIVRWTLRKLGTSRDEEPMRKKPTYYQPKPGERGMTELHFAAYCGDLEGVVACLADGGDVHARDEPYGYTPLHWVVDMGCVPGEREEIVRVLLDAGADIDAKDDAGRNPLKVAIDSTSDHLANLLRQLGARG